MKIDVLGGHSGGERRPELSFAGDIDFAAEPVHQRKHGKRAIGFGGIEQLARSVTLDREGKIGYSLSNVSFGKYVKRGAEFGGKAQGFGVVQLKSPVRAHPLIMAQVHSDS